MKPSRWQAFVWASCVLRPGLSTPRALLLGGYPIGKEQLPNIKQIGRYYPSFAKAREALLLMPENDKAEQALINETFNILHSLPTPYEHFDLAFAYDELVRKQKEEL